MLARYFLPGGKLAFLIRALTAFVATYYVAILFVRIFICIPISAFWNGGGKCLDLETIIITDAFMSLITNVAILVLPIVLVWSVNLPLGKKLKVVAILGRWGSGYSVE